MDLTLRSLESMFEDERESFFEQYFQLLRFPSVSTEPHYAADVDRCSHWVAEFLQSAGFAVERWTGAGHPIVFASWAGAGPAAKTALFYGHYDVQPVDPLELWQSRPFEPEIRAGEVYARGAQDNKGQLFYTMSALCSILKHRGALPMNVKMIIEGEEESSSAALKKMLPEKRDQVRADYLAVVDVGMKSLARPWVGVGVRGIAAFEIVLHGSDHDLHSGMVGGIAYNPNRALVELLAKAVDENGRVTIPGFYDGIEELPPADRAQLCMGTTADESLKLLGVAPFGGESGLSIEERVWLRPTFEINGLNGGYTGDGFKTVIPARASAKISCRLVPGQDPIRIQELVCKFLEAHCPKSMKIEVRKLGSGSALRTHPNAAIVKAAVAAFSDVAGTSCGVALEGGSIPISLDLSEASGGEIVFFGYGLGDDQIHAPNEHFGVDRMRRGFLTVGRFLAHLAGSA